MEKILFEDIKEVFESRGYQLLETKYIKFQTPMRFRCPKHPDEESYIRVSPAF